MVDASVVLKWFLPEPLSTSADRILNAFLRGRLNLHAPDFLLIEAANALWKRAILGHGISARDCQAIYRDLVTLPLNLYPSEQLAGPALDLAVNHKYSLYDLVYCALALDLRCDLVTSDATLVSKLGNHLTFIRHLSAVTTWR